MRPPVNQLRFKVCAQVFAGMMLVSVLMVAGTALPSSPASPRAAQFGDSISPGFFSPPAGVQPVNRVAASRIPGARRSYAWRIHGNKRELIAFSTPIQHVVVIYMENRTPENLFGAFFGALNPRTGHFFGVDLDLANPQATNQSPMPSPLAAHPLTYPSNPNHEHSDEFISEASGTWDSNAGYWYVPTPTAPASASVSNYITLIEDWAYENHTLQSNEGPSFEAHQYAIAGQSGGLSDSNITPEGMVDNPKPRDTNGPPGNGTCATPGTTQSALTVNMYSPYPLPSESAAPPCNEYPTILDFMASAAPSASPYEQWQYVPSISFRFGLRRWQFSTFTLPTRRLRPLYRNSHLPSIPTRKTGFSTSRTTRTNWRQATTASTMGRIGLLTCLMPSAEAPTGKTLPLS